MTGAKFNEFSLFSSKSCPFKQSGTDFEANRKRVLKGVKVGLPGQIKATGLEHEDQCHPLVVLVVPAVLVGCVVAGLVEAAGRGEVLVHAHTTGAHVLL